MKRKKGMISARRNDVRFFSGVFGWLVVLLVGLSWVSPAAAGTIEASLRTKLDGMSQGDMTGVIVMMKEQADLGKNAGTRTARLRTLTTTMARAQADCIAYVVTAQQAGRVSAYRQYHIVDALAMTATRDIIEAVAARADVNVVVEDRVRTLPPVVRVNTGTPEWNIQQIGAPAVWNTYGIRGNGVVIGHIDTGVDGTHPDLAPKFRGGERDFFNAVTNSFVAPFDDDSHGTHTMGTILGGDTGGTSIGVAPEATWIAAKAFDSFGSGQDSWILSAMDYMTDPDGDPLTDDAPTVVNNSWGTDDGLSLIFQTAVQNWVALGIFPTFSNGNNGPGAGTVGVPASYPESFGVGATDMNDLIAGFSSRGPSPIAGEVKPDVSAPGVGVFSAMPGGGYQFLSGTSMAAPHVTGVVALLEEADPTLTVDDIRNILESTSLDLGTPGDDNDYGHGRLDAFAAVTAALNGGTLTGTVTEGAVIQGLGDPVAQATIRIIELGLSVQTDQNGVYSILLPESTYTVEASADGFGTQQAQVTIVQDQTTTRDFVLEPGSLQATPASFTEAAAPDSQFDRTLTLSNPGGGTLQVDIERVFDTGPAGNGGLLSIAGANRIRPPPGGAGVYASKTPPVNTAQTPPPGDTFLSPQARILSTAQFLVVDHGKDKTFLNNHTFTLVSESQFSTMTADEMANFDVIYMEPDWSNYGNLTAAMPALSAYIDGGGVAVINVAGNIGNGTGIAPGGVDYDRSFTHENAVILDAGHPYVTGMPYGGAPLTTPDFNSWSSTDHGTLSGLPGNAEVVLENADGPSWVQYDFGRGDVIVTTLTYGWGINGARGNPLLNIVEYSLYLSTLIDFPTWLTVDQTDGELLPDSTLVLNLHFDSTDLANFTYRANIRITSNDPNRAVLTVPVDMTVSGAPDGNIHVAVPGLTDTLETGAQQTQTLTIANTGAGPLQIADITDDETVVTADAGWLSEDARFILIAPGDSARIGVRFDAAGLSGGTFTANLRIESSDPDEPTLTIPVTMTVTAPDIAVTPASFDVAMQFGNTRDETMTIANEGDQELTFSISSEVTGGVVQRRTLRAPAGPSSFPHIELGKNQVDPRHGPPVVEASGGPDDFGYQWIDSDDPTGPAFDWVDITSIGTPVALDDDDAVFVTLPFPFSFYGNEHTSLYISSNGYLTFNNEDPDDFTNDAIPDDNTPNDIIAPFWDDLDPDDEELIYYHGDENEFIVEYFQVPRFSGPGLYTFEVILSRNGEVRFQYLDMVPHLDRATIGVENGDGTVGLQVAFNQEYVHNDLAVRLSPNLFPIWFTLDRTNGVVEPDSSTDLTLSFDTTELPDGDYNAELTITSNDPDEGALTVPVHLRSDGQPPPDIAVTPDAFEFLLQPGDVASKAFQIRNDGDGPLLWRLADEEAAVGAVPWLSEIPPLEGVLQAGDSTEVGITVDTSDLQNGEFAARILITSNDPDAPVDTVEVALVVDNPEAAVAPDQVARAIPQGISIDIPVRVSNAGGVPLEFSVTLVDRTGQQQPAARVVPPSRPQQAPPEGVTSDTDPGTSVRTQAVFQGGEVLILQDRDPWGFTSNEQALQMLGITYDMAGSADLPALDLTQYRVVIMSSVQDQNFYNVFDANLTKFEGYVAGGGVLEAHVTHFSSDTGIAGLPGGVTQETFFDDLNFIDVDGAGHPILEGLVEADLHGNSASHQHFLNLAPGTMRITRDSAPQPTTIEYPFGSGRVIATGMTYEWAWGNGLAFAPILTNTISHALAPKWALVEPFEGRVDPGASFDLTLTLTTVINEDALLPVGTYQADLIVRSNDPANPELTVPIRMNVEASELVVTDIRVSNTTSNSARIGWKTDLPAGGVVHYGLVPGSLDSTAEDVRDAGFTGTVHVVDLTGLAEPPGTTYFYGVESAGTTVDMDAAGNPLSFTTAQDVIPAPGLNITGQILDIDGNPVEGAHLYLQLSRNVPGPAVADVETSRYLSALTGPPDSLTALNYTLNLGNLKDQAGAQWQVQADDQIVVHVQGGDRGVADRIDTVVDPGRTFQNLGGLRLRTTLVAVWDLPPGFSLRALPGDPLTPITASDLLLGMPAQRVTRWLRDTKRFENAVNIDGQALGSFPLRLGDGYFIRVDDPRVHTFEVLTVADPVSTDLIAGLNIVSVPAGHSYTSHTLIPEIPTATEVVRWRPEIQAYESAFTIGGGVIQGPDFEIRPGEGYFTRVESDGVWTIGAAAPAARVAAKTGKEEERRRRLASYPALPLSSAASVSASGAFTLANLTPVSVTVAWTTREEVPGQVAYGPEGQIAQAATETVAGRTHWIELTGLRPETAYQVRLNGKVRTFTTPPFSQGTSYTVFGRAVNEDGRPSVHALVTVRATDKNGAASLPLAARTDSLGFWSANLGNMRDGQGGVFAWQAGQALDVSIVNGDERGSLHASITGESPQSTTMPVAAEEEAAGPKTFSLNQNYPNPFNPTTTIRYEIPKTAHVELIVYNILGQRVVTLVNGRQQAGRYAVQWSGRNASNLPVASGVYLYRIKAGNFTSQKKMLLLK